MKPTNRNTLHWKRRLCQLCEPIYSVAISQLTCWSLLVFLMLDMKNVFTILGIEKTEIWTKTQSFKARLLSLHYRKLIIQQHKMGVIDIFAFVLLVGFSKGKPIVKPIITGFCYCSQEMWNSSCSLYVVVTGTRMMAWIITKLTKNDN